MSTPTLIPVTKPFQPPLIEVQAEFDTIWARNWLTNNGPNLNSLEEEFKKEFDLPHCIMTGNGTFALQMALRAIGVRGKEVVTTPVSYVATTSSIVWEGAKPVFVDVLPKTMCADPDKIRESISPNTAAILLTHCYGLPCDVEAIEQIGIEIGIPVIYDAAHAAGSTYGGRSLLNFGDVSITSLHATKMLHAVEGGAIVCRDRALQKRLQLMRNFGHKGAEIFDGVGVNNKMSEFHAAIGRVNIRHFEAIKARRIELAETYDRGLKWGAISPLMPPKNASWNRAYYPVIFESEELLLETMGVLQQQGIQGRRYFYPALHNLDYVKSSPMPIADSLSRRVFCLPIFHDLSASDQERVISCLNSVI
jgi:dTDP-4-amino-4,6-dideoxygalactose transaminase